MVNPPAKRKKDPDYNSQRPYKMTPCKRQNAKRKQSAWPMPKPLDLLQKGTNRSEHVEFLLT